MDYQEKKLKPLKETFFDLAHEIVLPPISVVGDPVYFKNFKISFSLCIVYYNLRILFSISLSRGYLR